MTAIWRGAMAVAIGSLLVAASPVFVVSAHASTDVTKHQSATSHSDHSDSKHPLSKTGKARYASSGGSLLQCVTFARAASGITLKGNAVNWWDAAAGVYERGSRPEAGSVLNFRANGHMRLGHVAVVTNVLGSRVLEIDHANWAWVGVTKGNVSRGIKVMDVSPNNDWSMVRVELGHSDEFGSDYPTYGFIYDRPDSGRMVANTDTAPEIASPRAPLGFDEVAEAPATRPVATNASLSVDAPDHSLR